MKTTQCPSCGTEVAAAGESEGIAPRVAAAIFAAVISGLVMLILSGLLVSMLKMMA